MTVCGLPIETLDEKERFTGTTYFCSKPENHSGNHGIFLTLEVMKEIIENDYTN